MVKHRATLKDIASASCVSVGTVDRAINGRGRISKETKRLVLEKIQEMDYKPNTLASTLRKQKICSIALIIPRNNYFFQAIIEGAKKASEELGDYSVLLDIVAQDSEDDPQRQLDDLERVIRDGRSSGPYSGLIIAPLCTTGLTRAINAAVAQGIQVVTVNMDAMDSARTCYIGQDPWRTGGIIASIFGKYMNNAGEIAVLQAVKGRVSWQQREEGFLYVLGNDYPGISIAGAYEFENDQQTAYELAKTILQNRPLGGIFANTTDGTIGIGRAIRDMGLKGKVVAVSYDARQEGMKLLDENAIIATVTQNPYFQGYYAARIMCRILLEQYKPEREMWYTSADIIVNSRQLSLNAESVNNMGNDYFREQEVS